MVELVELMQAIFGDGPVSRIGMKKSGGKRCVDLVEELEKEQTDAISVGKEPITPRVGQFFNEAFGAELPHVT